MNLMWIDLAPFLVSPPVWLSLLLPKLPYHTGRLTTRARDEGSPDCVGRFWVRFWILMNYLVYYFYG